MSHQPIDKLIDSERIKGQSRIVPDGILPAAVTEEMRQQVAQAVRDFIGQRPEVSRSGVARSIGISPTTLGLMLNETYMGNWRQLTIDLDLWIESQIKREASAPPADFVWTRVATEIKTVATVAQQLRTIGLVYGPESAGYGKTMALRAIAASKPGSVVVTLGKLDATAAGLVKAIAWALKISCAGGLRGNFERIKEKLAGSDRLLMIDQIHCLCGVHAGDKPLFILADLFDATGSPQLWAGTSDVVKYLQRGQAHGKDSLAQVRRRIGCARDLTERTRTDGGGPGEPLYSLEEIAKVFASGQMRLTPCAIKYLWQLANSPDSGALGTASNLVRMATLIHKDTATALTGEMLRVAHRMLVSRGTFAAAETAMNQPAARRVRVG